MTKTSKILIGVGAIALVYYIYKMKGSYTVNQATSTPKKENDAKFSNIIGNETSCARLFCLPNHHAIRNRVGDCICVPDR